MRFREQARQRAIDWKATTDLLPDAARAPAPYGARPASSTQICIPSEFASFNLLPGARDIGLTLFARDNIAWHDGVDDGPSNHLLDSQVQCVNALAPLLADGGRIRALFGHVLDIGEIQPWDESASGGGEFLTFEYPGLHDYLGYGRAPGQARGKLATTADAAFRYTDTRGRRSIALIEWKYTESYDGSPPRTGNQQTRFTRYRRFWDDPDSPLRHDVVSYEELFVEPLYQLMRLQFLAHEMENAAEADRVTVLYASPATNEGLAAPHALDPQRNRPHVAEAWPSILRRPDRFTSYDTARLVTAGAPTSIDFRQRYGHLIDATASSPQSNLPQDRIDGLRASIDRSRMMIERVFGYSYSDRVRGCVVDQVGRANDDQLARVDPNLLDEVAARLDEIGELVQRLRAEPISAILEHLHDDDEPG